MSSEQQASTLNSCLLPFPCFTLLNCLAALKMSRGEGRAGWGMDVAWHLCAYHGASFVPR